MHDSNKLDRRVFLKSTAAGVSAAAVGNAMLRAEEKADAPKVDESKLIWRSKAPGMEYRRLGRTNYMCSRIVNGWAGEERSWCMMIERGMNYFDTARGYGDSEEKLRPFVERFRDRIWITSKATDVGGYSKIDPDVVKLYREAMKRFLGDGDGDLLALHKKSLEKAKATGEQPDYRPAGRRITELYARKLDESLKRLGTDHVDCYFVHGVEIPWMFQCTELWDAYAKAHKAGKVKHFGFSTHKHQKEVLAAAVEANSQGPWKIDLIMPGVNPESFDHLKPELEALKKQDVGVVAMKTSGIKNRPVDGREEKLKNLVAGRDFNEWERAKLWMLHLTDGNIDACIAAMKSIEEMEKDLDLPSIQLSAEARRELNALVKYEMAGACHLCGSCETHCPEHIAVVDMVRYHAYIHQYNEKEYARELYAQAGYNPAKVCNNCGKCADACSSSVPITQYLHELSIALA
ncbi:MAG: hypothetical protein AMXMBFR13_30420 [Phycisphaerae bacterium]